MTDNDLFSSTGDQPETPQINEDHDYLADLVGEGKKFKDLQALARSTLHKEMHIRNLEKENADFRQAVQQGLTREEFYEAIKSLQQPSPSNPAPKADEPERNEVSVEQIQSLVRDSVNQTLTEKQQESNLVYAVTEAHKALGPNFQRLLKDRAKELGESEADLTMLARTKPKVFLELMVPKASDTPHIPSLPRSSVDSGKGTPSGSEVRNMSYYKKLKQTDPARYKSQATEIQMHKDAMTLGEKFFQ